MAGPQETPAGELPDFRLVADSTYDWESWHDPAGALRWVNPAVARHTGYHVEECLAMADYPFPMVAREDAQRLREVLASAARGDSGHDVEFSCLHRDGTIKAMAISWQPMLAPRRGFLGFRTSVRDVTERRKLQAQLQLHVEHLEQLVDQRASQIRRLEQRRVKMEQLAALGQLAAGIAHEINNPLAGIRNAFQLLRDDLSPKHPRWELLALVDREIERMSGIVGEVYQLYGAAPQAPQVFSLAQAVNDVLILIEPRARRAGVPLKLAPPPNINVCLPQGKLKQVLINVLCNAILASSEGQAVRISASVKSGEACIEVADEGRGIEPEHLRRIFEPFYSRWQDDSRQGMGLGLSVSRDLMEAISGRIEVESELGRGSRFRICFPLTQSAELEPVLPLAS